MVEYCGIGNAAFDLRTDYVDFIRPIIGIVWPGIQESYHFRLFKNTSMVHALGSFGWRYL